ncbi:CobD/CbiB family cobalamin biosynthesis protein [Ideonella sp.]|uniref:CobD/CbiB family cobalamin biosynthesis protein n=1 Tax=Ideonella sp. TaxID=1929293 RepID=UPI00351B6BA4
MLAWLPWTGPESACAAVLAVAVALAVDRWLGEPPLRWHPVVLMGRYLGALGLRLWPLRPTAGRVAGALAWLLGAAGVAGLAWALQLGLARLVVAVLPAGWGWLLQGLLAGLLLKPLLAWQMLHDEVAAVESALGESLDAGRLRLSRLVSRDVTRLSATEVRESALESLAENLNDSLVAPLCWFALAGLPGAALYRFANTADAMWGYRDHQRWAGAWAARVDDVLSWLPARLSALLLCAAAWRWPGAAALRREAGRTPSPNGGWPMGALALLLDRRLGKPATYVLNHGAPLPQSQDTALSLRWCARAAGGAAMLASSILLILGFWTSTTGSQPGQSGLSAAEPRMGAET